MKVAALYVDPRGPYASLPVDLWDEKRDARLYDGPHRVIAHPPCQQWGRLRAQAHCNPAHLECGPIAVDQVRRFGGVLEHPADSLLWTACELPHPFSLWPDEFGGRSVALFQGDYGHPAPKLTWLYFVGVGPCPLALGSGAARGRVALQHSSVRHLTPPELAARLVEWVGGSQ